VRESTCHKIRREGKGEWNGFGLLLIRGQGRDDDTHQGGAGKEGEIQKADKK